MKIIITGASGFVGKNLTQIFKEKGQEVIPLSLRKEDWQLPETASALVHLAGIEKDTGSASNNEEYFQVNSYLTEKVFQQFLKSDIHDFIFISSIKAAADSSPEIVTENTFPNPISPYGKSKFLAEELILKHKLPPNKRLIILRPCLIHGPEDTGNLKLLYKIAEKGIPYPFGKFENQRSYVSIFNLSFLLTKIIETPQFQSGIYNIADDTSISTTKLIEVMYNTLGKKPRILKIPASPIKMVAKIFSRMGIPLVEEKISKLTDSFVVSNEKIKSELGLKMLPLSAEDGLIKTIKSFMKSPLTTLQTSTNED